MDIERVFTQAVAAHLVDSEVLEFAVVGRTTFAILECHRDAINSAKLIVVLRLLGEISGGDSIAEVRAARDAEDYSYWLRHVAVDWDLSD